MERARGAVTPDETPTQVPSTASAARPATLRRREEIVVAAAACFAEQGYHTVGMREIAEAVGIKGASLYNHFGSKEEILHAIALRMTRDWDEHHLPVLETAGAPDERLAALVRAHVLSLAEHRVEHLVSLRELSALTAEHRAEVADYRRYYQRRVRDVIAAGARAGVFDVEDPTRAAIAVLDMLNGIVWWLREDHDVEALAEVYVGFAIDGVLRRRSAPPRVEA